MSAPTVSVVMSVYNGASYLREAIIGVLEQRFTDFEFLVADDGSTDGSWEILREYAARDKRLNVFRNEKNIGVAASVNNLLNKACGAYITRHDADDISLPGKLSAQVEYLNNHPEIGLLATYVEIIDEVGNPVDNFRFFTTETSNVALQPLLLKDCYLCQGSVMFRKQVLEQAGQYDSTLVPSEDYDLWLRYAEVTQIACLDTVLYRYRIHSAGQSKAKFHQQIYTKAIALDRALLRRFDDLSRQRQRTAEFYLKAALAKYDVAQLKIAQWCLRRAILFSPSILQTDNLLFNLLVDYISRRSYADALGLVDTVMRDLPPSAYTRRVIAKVRAMINMREVFASTSAINTREHLWAGIQNDPSWLFNRGVIARFVKLALPGGNSHPSGRS
jgi:glycosyltransferase involved in cell wall biosynthesis